MVAGEANVYTALAQQAIADIKGSLANITSAVNAATGAIIGATVNAAGQINTAAAALVQSEVNELAQDLQTIGTIIQGLNATVTIVSTRPRRLKLATTSEIACEAMNSDIF